MAADEQPRVATAADDPQPEADDQNTAKVRIPHGAPATVHTELSEQYTVVQLLTAVDNLSYDTANVLAAVVQKLEDRRRDLEELVSIAKSGQELAKKVKRLGERLLREERDA